MTKTQRREKLNWFLLMVGYFTAGYLIINRISAGRAEFFDVGVPLDASIPFIPVFIFGYILVYLSVLLVYFIINDMDDWHRAVVAFFTASTIAYVFFLILPVRMALRPDVSSLSGFSEVVTRLYYVIDLPYNCFPSLHVTYPAMATLVAWRNHPRMRWIFAVMTLIVAVSVVLVKQHYIADVIGGFANGIFCFWLTVKFERRWAGWFRPSNALPK